MLSFKCTQTYLSRSLACITHEVGMNLLMTLCLMWGAASVTLILLAPVSAHSEPTSGQEYTSSSSSTRAQPQASRREAAQLVRRGNQQFKNAQYSEAIETWRRAYSLFPDNKLLFYIASTYERIPRACAEEDQAWRAYFGGCESSSCYHTKDATERHVKFKQRCYVSVRLISNAPHAQLKKLERTYPLPHQLTLLRKRYIDLKVSAPNYISERLDFDLTELPAQTRIYEINTTLIAIPRLNLFERHKWTITGGTLLAGVALLSLGSLQMSSAHALRDQTRIDFNAIGEFASEEEQRAYNYDEKLMTFERKRIWGVSMITLGSLMLGAGAWSFFQDSPHQEILDRARRQGDLSSKKDNQRSRWSMRPLTRGGTQWSFELIF